MILEWILLIYLIIGGFFGYHWMPSDEEVSNTLDRVMKGHEYDKPGPWERLFLAVAWAFLIAWIWPYIFYRLLKEK